MAVFSQCREVAEQASKKYGLPANLLYSLLVTESGCRSNAVGPPTKYGTAVGIAQFLPSTFKGLGCPGSPLNPIDAINCAALYLSQLKANFGGSNALAVAGYHAGEGRVEKTAPCVPGTSDGLSTTLNYVKGILAKAGLPFDARDCSKSLANTPRGNPANVPPVTPTGGSNLPVESISPDVRKYIILGIGFILIILALGRVAK